MSASYLAIAKAISVLKERIREHQDILKGDGNTIIYDNIITIANYVNERINNGVE